MYSYNDLSINGITTLYLYGQLRMPDILSDSFLRPNEPLNILVDAVSVMQNSRFAYASLSPVVSFFMDENNHIGEVSGQRQIFTRAQIQEKAGATANFAIRNVDYVDWLNDHAARTYIWNSQGFTVASDARFVIEPDGTRHIENFAILPFDDNFDFESDNLPAKVGDLLLKKRLLTPLRLAEPLISYMIPHLKTQFRDTIITSMTSCRTLRNS